MNKALHRRFGGFLPVVVDCETGGYDADKDALLEVAAITLCYDAEAKLVTDKVMHFHVEPFAGAHISEESLEVTQIRPDHPFRFAVSEQDMLSALNVGIEEKLVSSGCRRAVLVGHNATFDLSFMRAAYARCAMQRTNPFHRFTTFDTATMGGICFGETVLARALRRAKIPFDLQEAHSALYDAEKTAELFCKIINKLDKHY